MSKSSYGCVKTNCKEPGTDLMKLEMTDAFRNALIKIFRLEDFDLSHLVYSINL